MVLQQLPYMGDGRAERSPELFFCKYGLEPGSIIEIGNVKIPGIVPDICVDLYEGPLKEDARFWNPEQKYDNVISISTIEHFGTSSDEFDWRGPMQGLENIIEWVKPGGFFYVTVPFGIPMPGLKRKAGEYWAQFYPPQNAVTFMPFTLEYIQRFRERRAGSLNFLFMKRLDIQSNRWAWCEAEDVVDCEMIDDGACAILIITNKDLMALDIAHLKPIVTKQSMQLMDRVARGAVQPKRWLGYASRIFHHIRSRVQL